MAEHELWKLSSLWGLPRGRIVMKQGGPTHLLPTHCFNHSRPAQYRDAFPQWTWERDVPGASAGVRDACADGSCDIHRLCIGWADLYYVPRRHAPRFKQLADAFARSAANAELAIPTILDILRRRRGAVWWCSAPDRQTDKTRQIGSRPCGVLALDEVEGLDCFAPCRATAIAPTKLIP